jgi:hypothetical protein
MKKKNKISIVIIFSLITIIIVLFFTLPYKYFLSKKNTLDDDFNKNICRIIDYMYSDIQLHYLVSLYDYKNEETKKYDYIIDNINRNMALSLPMDENILQKLTGNEIFVEKNKNEEIVTIHKPILNDLCCYAEIDHIEYGFTKIKKVSRVYLSLRNKSSIENFKRVISDETLDQNSFEILVNNFVYPFNKILPPIIYFQIEEYQPIFSKERYFLFRMNNKFENVSNFTIKTKIFSFCKKFDKDNLYIDTELKKSFPSETISCLFDNTYKNKISYIPKY